MADLIDGMIDEAEGRLEDLRLVQAKYPDARKGSIFGTEIVASEAAVADCYGIAVFLEPFGRDAMLLPFVMVGVVQVYGWRCWRGEPIARSGTGNCILQLLDQLRNEAPDVYRALIKASMP